MANRMTWEMRILSLLAAGGSLLASVSTPAQTNSDTNLAAPPLVGPSETAPATATSPATNTAALPTESAATNVAATTGSNQLTVAQTNLQPPVVGTFQVKRGFKVTLVASEPQVVSPAAMAFDEQGRLFVAEMRDYPDQVNTSPRLGRIRLLEDPENTGLFSTNYLFAEDLALPAGLVCYHGGVFAASGTEIIYLKDTDGDHRADARRTILSGFVRPPQTTVDQFLNSLAWGPDNRIHGIAAGMNGDITGPNISRPLPLAGADFSFDPLTHDLRRETGNGQSGLTFDNYGHKFVSEFSRPLRQPVIPQHYLDRNPLLGYGSVVHDVSPPSVAVFHASAETNRAASAWMQHAGGLTIYRGNAFPSNYLGSAFIPDREAGVIHRETLRDYGLVFYSEPPADKTSSEFLSSKDPEFHPTQVINGPDGCLYVSDFRSSRESGRIYRIQPERFQQPGRIHFEKLSDFELAALLGHPNGWHRDTATRLIVERKQPASAPILSTMLAKSRSELTRLHALSALAGLGALQTNINLGLRDLSPAVREHSLKWTENLITNGVLSDVIWNQVRSMVTDNSPRVRFQLALTAGQVTRPERIGVLYNVLRRDPQPEWLQTAVLSSVPQGPAYLFTSLASDSTFRSLSAGQAFLSRACSLIGVRGQPDEVNHVINFINHGSLDVQPSFVMLHSLGDGLQRTRSSLASIDAGKRLGPYFRRAQEEVLNTRMPASMRTQAIDLIGVGTLTYQEVGDVLLLMLGSGQPVAVEKAAVASIGRFDDPRVITNLLARWNRLSPPGRQQAVDALLSRAERIPLVMGALRNGSISRADVPPLRVHFLRSCRDAAVAQSAIRLFGLYDPQLGKVQQLAPILKLNPDPTRGRKLYQALCADCHRMSGEGREIGPDLARLKPLGKEALLQAIAEPNLTIHPGYAAVVLESPLGENAIGIATRENSAGVTLAQPGSDPKVWARSNVQVIQPQPWSLMPEGLLNTLTPQDLADLLGAVMVAPR